MILGGKSRCFSGLKWGFCCQLLSDFWKLTTIGRFERKKKHRKYKGFLCFKFESRLGKIQYLVRQMPRVRSPSSAPKSQPLKITYFIGSFKGFLFSDFSTNFPHKKTFTVKFRCNCCQKNRWKKTENRSTQLPV